MSNAQQKNVPKTTSDKCKDPGQRIFVDMSSVSNHTSLGGAKVWLAAVDDATDALWSHMMKKKSNAPDRIKNIVRKLDDQGNAVQFMRMDDAAKLKSLPNGATTQMKNASVGSSSNIQAVTHLSSMGK
jgi:hypothetical protein